MIASPIKFQQIFLVLKGSRRPHLNIEESSLPATDHEIKSKLVFKKYVEMLFSEVNKEISAFPG